MLKYELIMPKRQVDGSRRRLWFNGGSLVEHENQRFFPGSSVRLMVRLSCYSLLATFIEEMIYLAVGKDPYPSHPDLIQSNYGHSGPSSRTQNDLSDKLG
jgi:hypothetical protein